MIKLKENGAGNLQKTIKIFKIIVATSLVCLASFASSATLQFSTMQKTVWGQSVYVVGDHPYLGNNDPARALKLSPHKYPTWEVRINVQTTSPLHYRFFIKADGPNTPGTPDWISNWQTTELTDQSNTYSLHTIPSFSSQFLQHPRNIYIFKPDRKTDQRVRLFYFHDGQNLFSSTATAPGSLELERWLPALAQNYPHEQLIVIGIANSPERMREYVPPYSIGPEGAGIGNLYARFIVEELIPTIERDFLKLSSTPERTIAGASLGGLISVYLAANFSELFTSAISLSGSFEFSELTRDLGKLSQTQQKIYLDSGTEGPGNDNYFDNYFMRDKFLELGWIYGGNLLHVIGYGHHHNEEAWRQRLPGALRWTLHQ
ncbi:MAG: hypothetical protein A2X86_18635 [Bdellovibrionales bacterium GWA2_49_15]|nr:MAG: hypothetical protein A2X86_18635 [Bdellovibrionales bacterium GWA2_49_15]HAZ14244.1 hypothetical protein [Bdellovibrionales bacterium]